MHIQWKGVYPALTSPLTKDDSIDVELFRLNLRAQIEAGVDGLIVGGSLGEASVLEAGERELLLKVAMEEAEGRIPSILNIAEGSTREAIRQAKLAVKWGADGLMVLPPMRYKSDERETVHFYKSIAASVDLPIMVYNNPVDYRIEITPAMFDELLDCDNIQAVKESTRDVTNVTRLVNRFGDRLKILCGVDTLAMEEIMLGADGWVAGLVCAFPKETVAIYRLLKAGYTEEARRIYRWFMPLLELDIHPKLVQYIKLAQAATGLGSEYVRSPRLVLEGEERKYVLSVIEEGLRRRPALPDYLNLREVAVPSA